MRRSNLLLLVLSASCALLTPATSSAAPSAAAALQLAPIQKQDVDYDTPSATEVAGCTIKAENDNGRTGWVVRDASGQMLRKFSDNNKDNVVDRWAYYKNGLEVYCDIDANFNGKADNYRWFHTGGTRWGVDSNEDGKIDAWKMISAEEVAAEVVAALRAGETDRFARLLITETEMESLGLGAAQAKELTTKLAAARNGFSTLASRQKVVGEATKYVSFGGTQPGIVPAGAEGADRDLVVYENVGAMVETGGKHEQVFIGTLIRSGNVWRLIDLPKFGSGELADMGYFFRVAASTRPETPQNTDGPSPEVQQMMSQLEKLEQGIAGAAPALAARLNAERADLLTALANKVADAEQQQMWLRQLADTLSAAVQAGAYPDGLDRLKKLEADLIKNKAEGDLIAYTKFRRLSAEYAVSLQDPKADFAKIQEKWLADLSQFVKTHPTSPDSAEAMLQLGIAEEFAGDEEEATAWYGKIVKQFPKTEQAKKATGARTRLDCVGKAITLRGPAISGRTVDLAQYRGKMVVVQYWATWCEPCKADMSRLKELLTRYGRTKGFTVIGVNLDHDTSDVAAFLKQEKLPWEQLYEPGGLESRLANEMGILTLPTMLLIDKSGRVLSRNVHVGELEAELRKLK